MSSQQQQWPKSPTSGQDQNYFSRSSANRPQSSADLYQLTNQNQLNPNLNFPAKSFNYEGGESSSFVPSNAFNELQHEVSSLLEFKNALLETFPHLQGKLGGATSSPRLNYTSPPPSSSSRTSSSTLRGLQDHQRAPDQYPPTTATRAGGNAITRHDSSSDEIPGSWNGPNGGHSHGGGQGALGTLSRTKPRVRKSFEGSSAGSNIIDSGFSTETNNTTMTKDISSILGGATQLGVGPLHTPRTVVQALDVRWDGWEGGVHGSPPEQDELLFLLDVIHRKTAKLKKEADSKVQIDDQQGQVPPESESHHTQQQQHPYHHRQSQTSSRRLQPQIPNLSTSAVAALRAISESGPGVDPGPSDVATLRRERDVLIQRVLDLEAESADTSARMSQLEGEVFQLIRQKSLLEARLLNTGANLSDNIQQHASKTAESDSGEAVAGDGGIVHSVQIRTGGQGQPGHPGDLKRALSTSSDIDQHQVNIEIKQRHQRYSHPTGRNPATVVNLQGSVDNLLPHQLGSSASRSYSFNEIPGGGRQRMGSAGSKSRYQTGGLKTIPSRIVVPPGTGSAQAKVSPQLNRVLSKNLNPKSKSVENLFDGVLPQGIPAGSVGSGGPTLGLKAANSEMNMLRRGVSTNALGAPSAPNPAPGPLRDLRGAISEMNVNRLGENEKLRLETMEGISSMPVELTRGLRGKIRPNRDKIRAVLNMNNVIELQRHLLTTVMENEVYKTQLERFSDGWSHKLGDLDQRNGSLHEEMARLRRENEELNQKMGKRVVELESTKARLKLIERNQHHLPLPHPTSTSADTKSQRNLSSTSSVVAGNAKAATAEAAGSKHTLSQQPNNRVQFDLKKDSSSVKKVSNVSVVEGLRAANAVADSRLSSTGGRRGLLQQQLTGSALPSDTRQRLEEMAMSDRKNLTNKSSATMAAKDPVQELIASRFSVNNNTSSKTATATAVASNIAAKPPIGRAISASTHQQTNNNRFRSHATSAGLTSSSTTSTVASNTRERSLNLKNSNTADPVFGDVSGNSHQQHSSSPNLSTNNQSQLSINDPSKKVRPKSFWASWWRF